MNTAEHYTVTPATVADALDIGALHVDVWRQTYAGVMDSKFLTSLDIDEWRADWVRQLTHNHATRVFVARNRLDGDRLVGFASAGPARDEPAARPEELYVLNVDATSHGSGVAQRLLTAVLGEAPAYLWVVEGNERAIRFYEKFGFLLGEQLKWDEHSHTNDVIMTRDAFPEATSAG
jgi:ribosomal protein S18 acetylase RimI-like enzyme